MRIRDLSRSAVTTLVLSLVPTLAPAQSLPPAAPPPSIFQPRQPDQTWVRIAAFTDAPLAGATVRITDLYGRVLFHKRDATNIQGVYPALVTDLPREFRVIVISGREQDERAFKLSADVRNFDPVHGIVFVNPATTMVSRLIERFPRLELDQAQALVRRLLRMPADASLGAALREGVQYHPRYFSETAFVNLSNQRGGIDSLINRLVTEAEARRQTALFAPNPNLLGGVTTFIARNLVSGALSWAGGQGAGWVARSAGLTTPGATAAAVANLQAGLNDLQSSVADLKDQLMQLQNDLSAQLTQTQYNSIAVLALPLAAQVDGVSSDLTFYAVDCPPLPEGVAPGPPDAYCTNQSQTIKAELNDVTINHSFETLATYLQDNPAASFKGMLHLLSQALGQSVRFFRPADSNKIQTLFDYFDAAETQAAALKVELQHLNGAPSPTGGGSAGLLSFLGDINANPATQGVFGNTHDASLRLIWPPVPVGTVINTKDRTMWSTGFPDTSSCLFYDDNIKVPPPRVWDYTPILSPVSLFGLGGWLSPTQTQAQNLISGWTGANPTTWLKQQTQAVAPDSPVSPGFGIVPNNPGFGPQVICPIGVVWTSTPNSGKYFLLNVYSGTFSTQGAIGFTFLLRNLASGEQYFWYP